MTRNSTASRRLRITATERQFTVRQSTHTLELNEWRAVETRRVERWANPKVSQDRRRKLTVQRAHLLGNKGIAVLSCEPLLTPPTCEKGTDTYKNAFPIMTPER